MPASYLAGRRGEIGYREVLATRHSTLSAAKRAEQVELATAIGFFIGVGASVAALVGFVASSLASR